MIFIEVNLSIYNLSKDQWNQISSLTLDSSNSIITAVAVAIDYVYISTYNYGFFKVNPRTFSIESLTSIFNNSDAAEVIYDIEIMGNGDLWTIGLRGTTAQCRLSRFDTPIP